MDIVLPGSFAGSKTISLFSSRASDKTAISRDDRHIKLDDPVHGYLSIIPIDDGKVRYIKAFCSMHMEGAIINSLNCNHYVNVGQLALCQYNIFDRKN